MIKGFSWLATTLRTSKAINKRASGSTRFYEIIQVTNHLTENQENDNELKPVIIDVTKKNFKSVKYCERSFCSVI